MTCRLLVGRSVGPLVGRSFGQLRWSVGRSVCHNFLKGRIREFLTFGFLGVDVKIRRILNHFILEV